MKTLKNILVKMRDGVQIALDIYLPSPNGRYGAVLYFGPYRKDDYILLSGSVAGLPEQYTSRGLAFVAADVRGTNDSEGIAVAEFHPDEQLDGAEVVEWIARQPWCNGKVGMTGLSYGFVTSVQAAAQNPPALKAIAPIHGSASWSYMFQESGMPMSFGYHGNYLALMLSYLGAPPGVRDERSEKVWEARLRGFVPWGLDWFGKHTDDETCFGSSLAPTYDKVKIPVFAIGGWWDRYPSEPFKISDDVEAPVKVLIGPWQHARPDIAVPGPRISYDIVLRWFEYWLNDVENGIMDEPPFTYYEQQHIQPTPYVPLVPGQWKHADRWSEQSATKTRFYLSPERSLSENEAEVHGTDRYEYDPMAGFSSGLTGGIYGGGIGMPTDQKAELANSILFSSGCLDADFNALGLAKLVIHFSSTARRMGIVAKLCDIAPDGSISLVTRGYLNISHRNGLDQPKSAVPGDIYRIEVEMRATSYVFSKGHKIGLLINSAEFPSVFPTPDLGTNTIHYGVGQQSYLELPSLPDQKHRDGPMLRESSVPIPETAPASPAYRIEKLNDHVWRGIYEATGETRCEGYTIEHKQVTAMQVDRLNPANAHLTSESVYLFRYENGETVESGGRIVCQGRADTIDVETILHVAQNDQVKVERAWERSYKRHYF